MTVYEINEKRQTQLKNAYHYLLSGLFPDKYTHHLEPYEIEAVDDVLAKVRDEVGLQEGYCPEELLLLQDDEISDCKSKKEYFRFTEFWEKNCISELMLLGKQITPFNTWGHICGVHRVAMHVARQMKKSGFPVDLVLVSAAALSHDLGKYGCTGDELKYVPYLHYYYTGELLERHNLPMIARIAGNHSVWDLERDSLSAEWMILIYADFRVKSQRDDHGQEVVKISSLEDAFKVILNKLDNLDEAKAARYKRAYSRLKKFEDYMIYLGVDPELDGEWCQPQYTPKSAAPFMMLDYQLRIAAKFNYLDQPKMEEMLEMLAAKYYEKSDGTKQQITMVMREILDNYDWINNKVLPEGVTLHEPEKTAANLRKKYKEILEDD